MYTNILTPEACEILSIDKESMHEWTFKVASQAKPAHGQFMQLSIPKVGEAPISVSAQGDGYLEFTIRSVGKVTDEFFAMQPGETIFMRGPYGKGWPLDKFEGKNLVVITGGTGLAPVRSMLNVLSNDLDKVESLSLISGFRNQENIVFKPELDLWKTKFKTIYTLDNEKIDGFETGLVTKFINDIAWDDFKDNYEVIVVGPPMMMKFTGLELVKQGIPEEKIWMSFERKMSCAVGKCGHCRIDETYVCLEGPVFNYTVAKDLVD